jgi:hypothetical protein
VQSISGASEYAPDSPDAKGLSSIDVPNATLLTYDSKLITNNASDTTVNVKNIGAGKVTINIKGNVSIGKSNSESNNLNVFNGDSLGKMGHLKLRALDGTPYYIYVEPGGTLRTTTAIPVSNGTGTIIGTQT